MNGCSVPGDQINVLDDDHAGLQQAGQGQNRSEDSLPVLFRRQPSVLLSRGRGSFHAPLPHRHSPTTLGGRGDCHRLCGRASATPEDAPIDRSPLASYLFQQSHIAGRRFDRSGRFPGDHPINAVSTADCPLGTRFGQIIEPPAVRQLTLERTKADPAPEEGHFGFTVDEMATIVERLLRDIGLTSNLARLLIDFGPVSFALRSRRYSAIGFRYDIILTATHFFTTSTSKGFSIDWGLVAALMCGGK